VVKKVQLLNKAEEKDVSLYRIGSGYGPLVGMAGDGKNVYSLYQQMLVRTSFESSALPMQKEFRLADTATVGPMIHGDQLFYAHGKIIDRVSLKNGEMKLKSDPSVLTRTTDVQDMALCLDGDSVSIASVDGNGSIIIVPVGDGHGFIPATTNQKETGNLSGEKFRIVCTDLNRDGKNEAIAVGSRGFVHAVSNEKTLWTKNYKRGAAGTSGLKDETSGIALGDINNDGYPEVVFLGDNLVYALDRFGLPLAGFPVKITKGTPVFGFYSDPLIVDVTGDEIPEILVPSNGGLVYAFTGKGKQVTEQFPVSMGSYEDLDAISQQKPMSIFVMDAVSSKKSSGPEIYAFHRSSATALRLQKASEDAAESSSAWTLPAGGNERTGYLDASKLKDVEDVKAKDVISEFFMFPNPVRGGIAQARFEVGAEAKSATLELFDITGLCVFKKKMSDVVAGRNQFENLDLTALGSDVYTARLQVKFKSGKTKKKLYRVGVIR